MIPRSKATERRLSFRVDEYVQLHPATDAWMRGDRYGTVVRVGRKHLHVLMAVSRKVRVLHPANVLHIGE